MNANPPSSPSRGSTPLRLVLALALALPACGKVTPKNFSEGIRVMTGSGGTHQERDILGETDPVARDMATYSPKPAWGTTLHADAADILEELPGSGILVGTVELDAVLANPSFGPIALYGADGGKRIWESPRKAVPGGSYHLLAGAPVILLQAVGRDSLRLHALDPATGAARWEWTASRPAVAEVHTRSGNVVTASSGKKGIEVKALRLKDGVESWRLEFLAPKGEAVPPALRTVGDDILLLSADRLARISASTGRAAWEVPNPAGAAESRVLPLDAGILLWSGNRAWLLAGGDGSVRWGPLDPGGDVRSLTAADAGAQAAFALFHSRTGGAFGVCALSLSDGKILWKHTVKGKVESSLLPAGKSVLYSTKGNLEGLDARTGKLLFSSSLPSEFSSRGESQVPDLLVLRSGTVVLSREKSGVAGFEAKSGKILWARTIDIYRITDFWYSVQEKELFEATGRAAEYKKMADKDRAWWNSYLYSWDQHWGTTGRGDAMMGLSNSLLAMSAAVEHSLRQGALNALAERKRLEMENSLALHTRSIQGRYWIRPFTKRGTGVTVVDLDTGNRADFEFSAPNYGMKRYGVRLPVFSLAGGGERLFTAGITLDPASWERYVKFKWGMPYPSLLAYRLSDLRFAPTVRDDQALVNAAEKGEIDKVRSLVEGGASLESRDTFGTTPLIKAASKGRDEVVAYLLAQGADPRCSVGVGAGASTAVERAAESGHASTVLLLLKAGADPDEAMRAAAKGDKPKVLEVIRGTGHRPPAATLKDAVLFGDAAAVGKFLDAGGGIDSGLDTRGTTPLILAASKGHLEVVRLLLDRGAKVNAQQKSGQKDSALMTASESGHIEVVRLLLERGASVNARDADGVNAVFNAAGGGHVDVLNLLIKAGGDVEVRSNIGKTTPLMQAAFLGRDGAVRALLAAGASHAKTDKEENSALSMAAFKGSVEAVRALLAAGANANAQNKEGDTPMMRAAVSGHLAVVKELIGAGANVNAVNKYGNTVLGLIKKVYLGSSITKKEEMVQVLQAAGAK